MQVCAVAVALSVDVVATDFEILHGCLGEPHS